jgi:GNAT superfamily N-acetyltransferase
MFTIIKSTIDQIEMEKEIINSNSEYNMIAFDKEQLSDEDLLKQHNECKELQTGRYLIKINDSYIGILDYGMSSPRAKKPWLNLLIVHKRFQGLGYAREVYKIFENLMKEKRVDVVQLAVHASNENAIKFWTSLGYRKYDERMYENKLFYSLEKTLT